MGRLLYRVTVQTAIFPRLPPLLLHGFPLERLLHHPGRGLQLAAGLDEISGVAVVELGRGQGGVLRV